MTTTLLTIAGFIVGGFIGLAFGVIQTAALNRNKKKQEKGHLGSGWMVMPGSMSRVAFLMVALVLVQIGMPMLFDGVSQWMVCAGVVLGYGWMLYAEFRRKVQAI